MDSLGYILSALIGSLPGLVALALGRRNQQAQTDKAVAEAAGVLTDTAMDLLKSLKERVEELEKLSDKQNRAIRDLGVKLERSGQTIRALLRGMALLIHQLQELGVTPAFVIPVYNGSEDIDKIEKALLKSGG